MQRIWIIYNRHFQGLIMNYTIALDENLSTEEDRILHEKILQFNYERAGFRGKLVTILVRDENKQIVGGLKGYCYGNALFVDILFMDEQLRGKGYGTQLMKLAEQEAKRNACDFVHLDTFSFQALPFYQKLGYTIYAELNYKPDIKRHYLKKDI